MKKFRAIVLMLLSSAAWAQSSPKAGEGTALNEISGEMLECSVYFQIAASCVRGHPDPNVPKLIADLKARSEKIGILGMKIGRTVGVTDDAVAARMKLMNVDMMKRLNNNCTNISILLERYSDFCKQLVENADPRLDEIMHGKVCTGSYKC